MDATDTLETVRAILLDLGVAPAAGGGLIAQRLREDLGLDSIGLVTLQVEVEDRFGTRFDPLQTDFVQVFATAGSLATFLAETLSGAEARCP